MIRSTLAKSLPWLSSVGAFFSRPTRAELEARIAELEEQLRLEVSERRRLGRQLRSQRIGIVVACKHLSRLVSALDDQLIPLCGERLRTPDTRSPNDA